MIDSGNSIKSFCKVIFKFFKLLSNDSLIVSLIITNTLSSFENRSVEYKLLIFSKHDFVIFELLFTVGGLCYLSILALSGSFNRGGETIFIVSAVILTTRTIFLFNAWLNTRLHRD